MLLRLILAALAVTLAGCSSMPDDLQVADGTPLLSYQQVASQPDASKGALVRWGGIIANVDNRKDDTVLEMVYYPLRSYGRPISGDQSVGRFRVHINGFLDPMVYQRGRSVTVVGKVLGTEKGAVGEHQYVFPTVHADNFHLWKNIQRYDVTTYSPWPYYGWYGWYGWGMFPYHSHIVVHTRASTYSPASRNYSPPASGNVQRPPAVNRIQRPVNNQPVRTMTRELGKVSKN